MTFLAAWTIRVSRSRAGAGGEDLTTAGFSGAFRAAGFLVAGRFAGDVVAEREAGFFGVVFLEALAAGFLAAERVGFFFGAVALAAVFWEELFFAC